MNLISMTISASNDYVGRKSKKDKLLQIAHNLLNDPAHKADFDFIIKKLSLKKIPF